ncbi:MAG: TonB-dependent receptor [Bacteroidota bacterium]
MSKNTLLFILLVSASTLFSQVPGKISGRVYDSTGEPLPGANVMVDGTSIGASSDIDGNYAILNISPGTYSISASYIGFQKFIVQNIRVVAGFTTNLDFTLSESSMELSETVVVTAKEQLVQKDALGKVATITQEELQTMPVENLNQILATQSNVSVLSNTPTAKAGYNIRGIDDIRMRGGRNNELALMIDGVRVSNPVFGGFGTNISTGAIKQIEIESGGFSARYGNALSGVINLTTRGGTSKTKGYAQYYSSDPFNAGFATNEKGRAQDKQNLQFSLSGGVPFIKDFSYFISAEANKSSGTTMLFDDILWDDYRNIILDDGSNLLLPTSDEIVSGIKAGVPLDSIQLGLGSNWKKTLGPDGRKVNPLDNMSGWQSLGWNNSYNFFIKFNYNITPTFQIRFSNLIDQRYTQYNGFDAYYDYNMDGQNVQIRNSDKQTLTFSHTLNSKSFYNLSFSRFFERRNVRILKDYNNKYVSEWNIFSPNEDNIKRQEEYMPARGPDGVRDPFETSFYLLGDNRWYSGNMSTNWEGRFDFTSNYIPSQTLETGVQFNYIDLDYHSYQNITSLDTHPTIYQYFPMEGAVYLQNKSELEQIIITAGLRLDYFNTGGEFWEDPYDPLAEQTGSSDTLEYNNISKVEPKLTLSPRIGIAYPLTDKSILSFNFGHFYQRANYRDMYRASNNTEVSLIQGNLIGNPHLLPEQAIQYELSLQQQVGDDFAIKLNLWAKETVNQVGSVLVPSYSDPGQNNPFTYSIFVNNNLGSGKGLEINIKKRVTDNWGFTLDYSYSHAKVLQATSWDGFWSGSTDESMPKRETTAPWDQTHVIRLNGQYNIPNDGSWFQNMNFNIIYYGESGIPYTPTMPSGVIVEPYSANWPFAHRVDLRIGKLWNFTDWLRMRMFLEVKNLLDSKTVIDGYTRTGSPTDPGTASYYTRSSTYWDSRNNNNFGLRRSVYLGIQFYIGGE